ncbi:MAG TPA: peptidylprolyl isomerase [Erysipelotrichaceae bacterium]|nr:peptidylprolyl isomerase [Erysipelotrichaceae bacterium]
MNSKNKNVWIWGLVIAVVVIGAVFFFLPHKQTTEASSLDLSKTYIADIVVKDYGTIEVELDPKEAPLTCENFIELANEGFYDNLTFHRIIKGFMIQGGDPNGDGTGGSEKTVKGEFSSNGVENNLSHERGVISMARSSDKDSASSQFFICDADDPFLDGDYAAFGKVIKGMDVVDKIADDAKPTDNNGSISKDEQPVIETITIKEQ